ncbi:hypothetical protein HHI36_007825, partial [Cryptolaemus montrouzieri]
MSIYSEEELDDEEVDPNSFPVVEGSPTEGDFIIVEFEVKATEIFYRGKVIRELGNETEVSLLRKSGK